MTKRYLLLAAVLAGAAWGQSTPQSLLVARIHNITSSWAGECAAGVVDNRSVFTRANNVHTFYATGAGSWTVAVNYSDTSCTGPWTSFGSPAQITQGNSLPVISALGYHPYIQIAVTGAASVTYAAVKDFFPLSTSGSGGGGIGSIGLAVPNWLSASPNPLTVDGTITVTPATGQTPHQVIGTCGSGTTFAPCVLVAGDIPALPYQAPITAGTTAQYLRGDLSLATFPTTMTPTAHAGSHLPGGSDAIPLWGSGSRPLAASALGASGNCAQWGAVGMTDAGFPCGSGGSTGYQEVPSGTIDGSNVTFTLANTPTASTLSLYVNGIFQKPTSDYTIASATIMFASAPQVGDTLYASYGFAGGGGGSMTWPPAPGITVYGGSSAWGTSLAAPTGPIVGTTDTQTLSNKTLSGATVTSTLTQQSSNAAFDAVTLGSEMTSSGGWTSTGWTGSQGAGFVHTTGNTSGLTESITISSAGYYVVSFTTTGAGSGTVAVTFGAAAVPFIDLAGTSGLVTNIGNAVVSTPVYLSSTGGAGLTFTPGSTFAGTITGISVKPVAVPMLPQSLSNDSTVTDAWERRVARTAAGAFFSGLNVGKFNYAIQQSTLVGPGAGAALAAGVGVNLFGYSAGAGMDYAVDVNAVGRNSCSALVGSQGTFVANNCFGTKAGAQLTGPSNSIFGDTGGANLQAAQNNSIFGANAALVTTDGVTPVTGINNSIFVGASSQPAGTTDTNEICIAMACKGNGSNTSTIGNVTTTDHYFFGNLHQTYAGGSYQYTGAPTTARTVALPDANSNTVQGIANPSDSLVLNYIGLDGVQHRIASSGTGTVTGPVSSTNNYLPQWNGTSGTLLLAGLPVAATSAANTVIESGAGGRLDASWLPAFTGDATTSAGASALTLATVNSTTGACGDGTHVCQVTTNGKGLVTAQTAVAITGGTGQSGQYTSVSFSATPTFTATSNTNNSWTITLTGNVTSSTLASAAAGMLFKFKICQDGTGGRTFAWPTGFGAAPAVYAVLNSCTEQSFTWDGSTANPVGSAQVTGITGALWAGPSGTNCASNPASGNLCVWFDGAANTILVKDSSGNIYAAVKSASGATANQYVTYIDSAGVQHVAAIASTNLTDTAILVRTTDTGTVTNTMLAGAIANAKLANSTIPINGTTCTLGSACAPYGGAVVYTANHTIGSTDVGKLVIMNCSGACAVTFEASPAATDWWGVESIGSTVATVSLNSKTYNGSASVPALNSFRDLRVASDGSNYFGDAPLVQGTNVTLTPASNGVTIAASGGSYTPPVTTKGDLFGYSTTPARIPVGADGQVLTADSSQALGIKWGAGGSAGSGIGRTTLAATWTAISDGACQDQTATWTGVSGTVILGIPAGLNSGLIANARISATDTVAIRLCNLSGATVTPGAQTFNATLAVYNLSGTGSLTYSVIPDGGCGAQTFTLPGVSAGDPIAPQWPSALESGLFGSMVGSATDTVQVRLCNLSGAPVTPAVQTFGAAVAK